MFFLYYLFDVVCDNSDKFFIVFGNQWWSLVYCVIVDNIIDQWIMDRMIFCFVLLNCGNRNYFVFCLGGEGECRYIVSLRKVYVVYYQFVMDLLWGGVDVFME